MGRAQFLLGKYAGLALALSFLTYVNLVAALLASRMAFDASRTYDPSANLNKVKVPVTAINSADDFINPPDLGIMGEKMETK